MAQHDYNIANQSGAAFRQDLNNGLAAIVSQNSGPNEPSTTYSYQWWADTTAGLLKIRNAANNAWVTIGTLASTNLGLVPSTQTATTSAAGIVQLNNTVTSTSTTEAATANAVKTANDLADAALPKSGGTMTGNIVFAGTQQFAGIFYNRRPPLHRGPLFFKTAATTISIVAGAVLNGIQYAAATAVTMPGSFTNNTDYAIWQNPSNGDLVGDASFTSAPAGATGGSVVGGFHYIPSGRPTAVNNGSPTGAAEILEYSIWDLTWRPECPDPRGMANIDGRFWADLYLCGKTSFAGTDFSAVPSSKIGLTIADNSDPALIPSFYGGNGTTAYTLVSGNNPGSWYNFAEVAHSFGKRLMWSWEFQAAAFGAPEAGSRGSDPGTVIWERQSKWGLAQATGTLWVWGAEHVITVDTGSNTNTGGRGTVFGTPRAVVLGGAWLLGAGSGSRSAYWGSVPSGGLNYVGARFAAGPLVLG